jgi:uncharacterized repeat protein (TIGR01451 family)
MRYPRTRLLIPLILVAGAGTILAQAPFQTREPPYADEVEAAAAKARADSDDSGVERAERRAPAGAPGSPRPLPGAVADPSVTPAQYSQVATPAGELPTPVVTLNVEGSDVTASGQPVIFKIYVRNVSKAKAHNVTVRVTQPKNAERIKWEPAATHDEADARWVFKSLEPGQEKTIEISYKPKAEAEKVELHAHVSFEFGRGMVTNVSPPSLSIKKEGPEKIVVGDAVTYRITVTNNGRVTVRDIEVKDMLNKGLLHDDREMSRGTVSGQLTSRVDPKTGERMWTIPALAPGQTKIIEYRVKANNAGRIGSTVMATATGVQKDTGHDVEVLTANLQVSAEGPTGDKGKVGQPAMYKILVENRGTADLKNVVAKCVIPPDMHATRATNGGQPFRDHVQWIFRELKAGESKELNIGLTTNTPGTRTVQFTAKADKGAEQSASVKTIFAGEPSIDWDTDVPGTIGVGKTMTYRVTVSNRGTAIAPGIQVRVDLPDNVDLISTSPEAGKGIGQNAKEVNFGPMGVPAGKKTTLKIEVKARTAGEARVGFQLIDPSVIRDDNAKPTEHKKMTMITGSDTRSPSGPPPAKGKVDPSTIGSR